MERLSSSRESIGISPQPFNFEPYPHGNVGLHNAFASVKDNVPDTFWIGVPGVPVDAWDASLREEISRRYGEEKNSRPVFVPDDIMETLVLVSFFYLASHSEPLLKHHLVNSSVSAVRTTCSAKPFYGAPSTTTSLKILGQRYTKNLPLTPMWRLTELSPML
jgi:hypothetical protein